MNTRIRMNVTKEFGKYCQTVHHSFNSKMNGSEAGVLFALKAFLTLRPYTVLVTTLVAGLLILGFSIRTFEVGLIDPSNRFDFVSNTLWLVIETFTLSMTTLSNLVV